MGQCVWREVGPASAITEDAVDGADAGDGYGVAHSLRQQLVPYLPREHAGIVLLAAQDLLNHRGRGYLLQTHRKHEYNILETCLLTYCQSFVLLKLQESQPGIHILTKLL